MWQRSVKQTLANDRFRPKAVVQGVPYWVHGFCYRPNSTSGLGMMFAPAIFALMVFGSVWANGPVGLPPSPSPGTQQQSLANKSAGPMPRSPGQHTLIQGDADYATCMSNVTGATAVALTCFAVAATHIPSGGVAGLFIGAGIGHFLIAPLACTPDPTR
jgi:hypothetical protein